MPPPHIIVIGASAGGFEALQTLVAGLPKDLNASIFVVWHMAPEVRGVLPHVLNKRGTLPVSNAVDGEAIETGRIYIAPPDRHMVLEADCVRVTRGPKENRFRPAVDPLFRSAAYAFGRRVIGIILSGALDDGSSGLWTIKNSGGIAIVQHPRDAAVPSMPESALRLVDADYTAPVATIAAIIIQLCASAHTHSTENIQLNMEAKERADAEIRAAKNEGGAYEIMQYGDLSPYACPECHGVLTALREGGRIRFRCHTGHAYSADSLLTSLLENIDDGLWNAIRGLEESAMLLNHLGDHSAERNQPNLAAQYFNKAKDATERISILKTLLTSTRADIESQLPEGR